MFERKDCDFGGNILFLHFSCVWWRIEFGSLEIDAVTVLGD